MIYIRYQKSATKVYKSDTYIENKYITDVKAKKRYVVPLVLTENGCIRINKVSKCTNELINNYLRIPNGGYYIYFDFEFTPYERDM